MRGKSAAERFDYLYTEDELREWVEPLKELSAQAENAYAVFNNNNRSPANGGFVAQAATNAQQLKRLLQEPGARVKWLTLILVVGSPEPGSGC